MPVRAIKLISGEELTIEIPSAVLNAFAITYNGIGSSRGKFVCEFNNHFDRSKNLMREVKEKIKLRGYSPGYIKLKNTSLARKYGFLGGEYLEIIFYSYGRTTILPGRMVEDLDFTPE